MSDLKNKSNSALQLPQYYSMYFSYIMRLEAHVHTIIGIFTESCHFNAL